MFLLYAVVIGLALGAAPRRPGGRPRRHPDPLAGGRSSAACSSRSPCSRRQVAARVGDLGPPIYVASTLLVGGRRPAELALPGMPLVAAGAACNLAAIVANGGSMPASRGRGRADGRRAGRARGRLLQQLGRGRSRALWFLTDIFALPRCAAVRQRVQRRRPADRRRDRGRDRARDALGASTEPRRCARRPGRRLTGAAGSVRRPVVRRGTSHQRTIGPVPLGSPRRYRATLASGIEGSSPPS